MLHAGILADPLLRPHSGGPAGEQFIDGKNTLLWIRVMSARAAIEFVSRLDAESRKAKVYALLCSLEVEDELVSPCS